ncbi:MAG: hypothetical protein F6J93_31110 [Oscillatoria sp. SIO1A7]|nr:hypothetical protein [Oscillatoria sp. SIO1A7]
MSSFPASSEKSEPPTEELRLRLGERNRGQSQERTTRESVAIASMTRVYA